MKIVINNCYGGFNLSEKAILKLAEFNNKYALEAINMHKNAIKNNEYSKLTYHCNDIPRHDPDLIKVVEELGEEANGNCCSLKIIEINIGYNINEYDGKESVENISYDQVIDL